MQQALCSIDFQQEFVIPQGKQKMNCHLWIIAVAITLLLLSAFSYSSVSAFSLQSVIHHQNKVFSKKQDSGSNSNGAASSSNSGGSNTKGSDKSNNEGNSNNNNNDNNNNDNNNNNNNQGTNGDGSSNAGSHGGLQAVEPANPGENQQQQETRANDAQTGMATSRSTPDTSCEQGSNCTDQQGLSDHDRSSSSSSSSSTTGGATTPEQDNDNNNNTPFVLSLPFP